MRLVWVLLAGLIVNVAAWGQSQDGQSVAEIARASRAKQQAQEATGSAPKVITNQDVAPGSEATPSPDPMTKASGVKKADHAADANLWKQQAQLKLSAQWKERLQEQETKIADLQGHIDRVKAQIQAAVGTASYDTPANRFQAVQNEKLATMQDTLEQEKRKLASMQDEARRAGAGQ